MLFAMLAALTTIAVHAVSKNDFSHYVSVTPSSSVSAMLGNATYANFPVLVRLPASASALLQSADGTDLLVQDENGSDLAFEVEMFDPSGTTFVWVKVPTISANTALTVYLGGSANSDNNPTAVWSKYVGVWHFSPSEAGGTTVADATGHGLGGTTTGTITTYAGPFGGDALQSTAKIQAPDYDSLLVNVAQFSASGWFKAPSYSGGKSAYHNFVSKKDNLTWNTDKGWYLEMNQSKTTANLVLTESNTFTIPDATTNWNYFHLVSDGSTVKVYMNGSTSASKSVTYTVKASSKQFSFCGTNGCADEFRIRAGAATAAESALEYKTMADTTFFDYGAVASNDTSTPIMGVPVVTRDAGGAFLVSVEVSEKVPASVAYDADGVTGAMTTPDSSLPMTYSATIGGLASGTTYLCSIKATSTGGTVTEKACTTAFYNGDLSVVKISDGDENGFVPGVFRISRSDTAYDLDVAYTVGGTAIADQTYTALSGTATIPAGSSFVDIQVAPLFDKLTTEDSTVVLSLAAGLYGIDANNGEATMTIANIIAPAGFNTWVSPSNSLASIDCNWSEGHSPTASEHVLFDGRLSTSNCTWDAAASATVASWTQTNDYTGVITLNTVYPGKGDFQCLTVTGPMAIHSGKLTHPQSRTQSQSATDYLQDLIDNEKYRIRIDAGSLVVGANGRIDARNKGYYHSNSGSHTSPLPAHGGRFSASGTAPYDDVKEPIHIGMPYKRASGTYYIGIGGGAIYITSSGDIVVDGFIGADTGSDTWGRGYTLRNGGAAGSVYIRGASVTGTGTISASAVQTAEQNNRGVGGRVAVISTSSTPVDYTTLQLKATVYPFNNNNGQSTTYGGCGTVFIKDATQTYGTLLVQDIAGAFAPTIARCTPVITEGDWTFDSIGLGNRAVLTVPVGTALHLPGGLESVFSLNAAGSTAYGSIRYEGGTLDIGSSSSQTMNGNWMLTPWSNLTVNANITVKGGAAIGVPAMGDIVDSGSSLPAFVSCNLAVNGNLTVESDSFLLAKQCGLKKDKNSLNNGFSGVLQGHTHGGRCMAYKNKGAQFYTGYDSVFAPCLPGNSVPWPNGQSAEASGGVISLVVSGALTLDGDANVNGRLETYAAGGNCSGGTGGSIDITAGTLSGSGRILAEAGTKQAVRGSAGRIAVKLTGDGADFSNFTGTISASGRALSPGSYADSSAGTVYLQTAANGEKGGTVYIAMSEGNRYATNTNTTEMVSLGYGGDAVKDYKKVNYVVSDYGRAAVNTNIVVASVKITDTNSFLDLEGNTLRTKSFGYPKAVGDETVVTTLVSGTYTAAELVERGIECVLDSSEGKTGVLDIGGIGFLIFVR